MKYTIFSTLYVITYNYVLLEEIKMIENRE